MIPTPVKPFPSYKWRWLSVAPTESLLEPPVFLGVLRVLSRHEEEAPSDPAVARDLAVVQRETGTPVNLVRTPERNLIRNSGQYWKGTGLLTPDRGEIDLTLLGRRVASGEVTQSEFAAIMVQQTVLPNPWTYASREIENWRRAGLEIRPLALILEILSSLSSDQEGKRTAFITPRELIHLIIPLAGVKASPSIIAEAIAAHRSGNLDVSSWPDCAPAANDHRLATEFLLFLANFGLCRKSAGPNGLDDKYHSDDGFSASALESVGSSIFSSGVDTDQLVQDVRHSSLPSLIDRQRSLTSVLARPGQTRFRDTVLKAYSSQCLLSGETIEEVLEAAHIVPVEHRGADTEDNGLCLRVDVHRLFDSGSIRMAPNGHITYSDAVRSSRNYRVLPTRIVLPSFVNAANLAWRYRYL